MFTPQQIDQISFGRATFGGYDMQQVDEFLEPFTEDYVTLYKEQDACAGRQAGRVPQERSCHEGCHGQRTEDLRQDGS